MKLWKTTIIIWTDYDPQKAELAELAHEATSGDAYCSKQQAEYVETQTDPNWDGTDFFGKPDDHITDAEAVKAQAARIRDLVSENQRLRKAAQMVIGDFDQTGCTKDIGTVMADNIDALRTALGDS